MNIGTFPTPLGGLNLGILIVYCSSLPIIFRQAKCLINNAAVLVLQEFCSVYKQHRKWFESAGGQEVPGRLPRWEGLFMYM